MNRNFSLARVLGCFWFSWTKRTTIAERESIAYSYNFHIFHVFRSHVIYFEHIEDSCQNFAIGFSVSLFLLSRQGEIGTSLRRSFRWRMIVTKEIVSGGFLKKRWCLTWSQISETRKVENHLTTWLKSTQVYSRPTQVNCILHESFQKKFSKSFKS